MTPMPRPEGPAGKTMPARHVIVNADDFGQSAGVNRGIIEAHERGIVTSASLMVRWPQAAEAAAYGRSHPQFSLGLHFDLGEWGRRDGAWVMLYDVGASADAAAVAREASRQLARFRELTGQEPTHLDSHQHVHRREPARSVLLDLADRLGVPLRHFNDRVTYCGDFYGQTKDGASFPEAISVESLVRTLQALPEGVTELACHPGLDEDLDSMYARERLAEARRDSRRRARAERMATARAEAKNSPLLQRHAGFGISLGARRVDRIAGPLGLSYASDFEQDLYIDFLFGATFQIGLLRLAPRVNMLYAGKKDEDSGEDTRSVGFGAEMVVGVGFQNRYVVPHIGARLGLNSLGAFVAGPEGGLDVFVGDAVVLGFYGGAFLDPSMWGGGGGVTLGLFPRPR